ncbi:MAG: hypothetical protein Q8R85_03195 [Bosea sp. (in: a-proteobacteria)]|uniref:hypothetical protein n=1 Tax=Bosea sp. (in: a-proteobacteria) TaxID=1871050 RepID=UPI002735679A|nr:hypothetical protein [Bosea sp. (in: a-proteobacteria)]MDP3600155.1 hypothetical protein [Bosea sp. (in: a-proteobacteria)]
MIIITTPRKIGELGRHLAKTGCGSNKQVIVRDDLIRDAPADTRLALRVMAALARRNRRVKRDIVHIKIAPKVALSPEALERVLAVIEEEYGIPFDVPRHIVEHRKGDRAPHFHVNYPMVVPGKDKALRFTRSEERDEMIARRLEIELGEGLTPSLRVKRVADMLRERGLSEFADIAATGPVAEKGLSRSKAERQQADRLAADPDLLDARLLEGWRRSGGDLHMLPTELEKLGFRLAAGDKLVAGVPMVRLIDTETLLATSLTRDLNRVRKAVGETVRIQEPELGAVIGKLPPEAALKAELRRDAPQRSATDLLGEFNRLVAETEADGEREEAAKARKGRDRVAARLSADEQKDLRERQNLVRSRYRQRDRIRRARVNRAFLAAKLFAGREIRKAAFYLVAVGVLATGAGLIPALAAAGIAVAVIPSYVGAKRLRAAADQAAMQERTQIAREVREESQRFFRERAVARRIAEQQQRAREERFRAAQANRQRMAQAEQLRRQQQMQQQRRLAEMEAMGRQRAVQAARLPGSGGQDPMGAGQAARRPVTVRQRQRGGGVER